MSFFDFHIAIVREPGKSVEKGLRSNKQAVVSYAAVLAEHRAYVDALASLGLAVAIQPPLENFPDSVFVEDTALVFPQGAILLQPGALSRSGERDEVRGALARHFAGVEELGPGEFVDGGDVLATPGTVFIGVSRRTNRPGAEALKRKLAVLGHKARIVETPPTVLHFKSACALIGEERIAATKAMAASGIIKDFSVLTVPEEEEAAANLLRIGNTVLVGEAYPRTAEMLAKEDCEVRTLPVAEVAKLDAGLSCMSLRW
jgi:dimethylargininase